MKKYCLIILVLVMTTIVQGQSKEPFARFPSVSPDASQIAFSYQGDIWTVPINGGRAWRLTLHEAYEGKPKWSPDGEKIAFISDRHGNDDVFVMNADGSMVKRLTYHSTDDKLTGWTQDGRVIFTTERVFNQVEWEPEVHTISVEGGTPTRFFDSFGTMAVMSPNERFLVFVRGSSGEYRKNYRGPANKNLWVYDRKNETYNQLTDFEGNDMYPAFAGNNSLFFISERDGTYNLYQSEFSSEGSFSGSIEQLTELENDGVRNFDVSGNGRHIVFESETGLYTLDLTPLSLRPLPLEVSRDKRYYEIERKTFTDDIEEFAVSPGGGYIAFVINGEIFIKRNDPANERAVKLTDHPWRDRDIAFLNDSTLIFASDRNGQYDFFTLRSSDENRQSLFKSLKLETNRLTSAEEDERNPVVSPDGSKIAFNRGRGQLVVADIEGPNSLASETVLNDNWAGASDMAWSPDSRWLAYSMPDLNFNREIYIHAADNSGEPVNISKHPRPDTNPVWSPDGSKLAFLSTRNNGDDDIWFAWLQKKDWERTQLEWDRSEDIEPTVVQDSSALDEVDIDFDNLYRRLSQVTSLPGNESNVAISRDGQTFYFVVNRDSRQSFNADEDLFSVKWDGSDRKALTTGDFAPSDVRLNQRTNSLFMLREDGKMSRYVLRKDELQHLNFRANLTINHPEQREQIFEEAWRTLESGFYDPGFHGEDWTQLHDHYKPWAMQASTERDFRDVINMMLGELNASHMGFYNSDRAETQDTKTGLLGVEVYPVSSGVRITHIIPDSPADREISKLYAGDIIRSVDGTPVAQVENFYSLLEDKEKAPTLLAVENRDGEIREVIIEPTDNLDRQRYNEWVEDRRRLTEKYSNGRLGYIHIQGMNWPSFERFERELVAAGEDKDGIVIDVRYNGGGWTTDYLLTVLKYRQHAYTIPRGAAGDLDQNREQFRDHYPYGERLPLSSWTRHSITLANQNSYSNAEIFSHAYKTLDLGTLIGEPTFGAVISTGGAGLMGGSFIRLPYRGWFVKATDENMENGPAIPDIEVINPPDYRPGKDVQLQRAVNELLNQID